MPFGIVYHRDGMPFPARVGPLFDSRELADGMASALNEKYPSLIHVVVEV